MPDTTITIGQQGRRVCFDLTGRPNDPPVLLVQGLGSQLHGWPPSFTRALAEAGFLVVRQDNRDVGRSQKHPEGGYDLGDMADDSAALLTELGCSPAHVVGQSMGGMIAQELALRHPGTVRSLALVYTAARTDHIRRALLAERRSSPAATGRQEAIERYVQEESVCAGHGYPYDETWIRELAATMYDRDHDPSAVDRQLAAVYASPDRSERLRGIRVPTCILHGTDDALIDPEASVELHKLIPASTLSVFDGMGHSLPEALWPSIVDEIKANVARSTQSGDVAAAGARGSS
jgi:pimeloyl-ACP methyl ester carboxylesterase